MNTVLIVQLLDAILMLVSRVPTVMIRIQAIRDEMATLRSEGRPPTPEEQARIDVSIDQRLQNLRNKLQQHE